MPPKGYKNGKPPVSTSAAAIELDKLDEQFKAHDEHVKDLTQDALNQLPVRQVEPQTKLSDRQQQKIDGIWLKPIKTIGCRDKFNEAFRSRWEFDKQMVKFIAENSEIIGEAIDMWTRPYGGIPAEEWKVPVNKVVWGPRYLAEQIKRKAYTRLVMQETVTEVGEHGSKMFGQMVGEERIQRLDARPVKDNVTVGFASNF